MKPLLSIVVPCYNEAENIQHVLVKFEQAFAKSKLKDKAELIIVDNNSKDNTQEVLKVELKKKNYAFARTVFQPVPGYGAAIKKGLDAAKGELVGWTHADLQTDPGDVVKGFELLQQEKNKHTVYIKGKRYGRGLFDNFFTGGMSLFETLVLRKIMYDINAQPNMFHRSFLTVMKNPPADFSFDLYAYYLAKKKDFQIKRFLVYFGKRIYGESKWNYSLSSKIKFIKRTISFTFKLKKLLKAQGL